VGYIALLFCICVMFSFTDKIYDNRFRICVLVLYLVGFRLTKIRKFDLFLYLNSSQCINQSQNPGSEFGISGRIPVND
jgi:hypothetical protein